MFNLITVKEKFRLKVAVIQYDIAKDKLGLYHTAANTYINMN